MRAEEYDLLVQAKKKRKRHCKGCPGRLESAPGQPDIPTPSDPAPSQFVPLAIGPYKRATWLHNYSRQMRELSEHLTKVTDQLAEYEADIAAGSTRGTGHFVRQGKVLAQAIRDHHDTARLKRQVHTHLSLSDLHQVYEHTLKQRGHAVPVHLPTSKTRIIEELTEDHGLHPVDVFDTYDALQFF